MLETLLSATRVATPDDIPEAEPVRVETRGDAVLLVLDDGEVLEFNRRELHAATAATAATA